MGKGLQPSVCLISLRDSALTLFAAAVAVLACPIALSSALFAGSGIPGTSALSFW